MMRILGITIPDTKRLPIALTEIYGIGRSRA
ncbi:MAG TPA: 30S ribosomal protein S13, partial [Candidatus Paceibacterota bacterium]